MANNVGSTPLIPRI